MKNSLILIILALSFRAFLFAQEGEEIREIQFSGLKRTKESTALEIIQPVNVGDVYTAGIEELVIQELRAAGIFNPEITVDASRIEGGVLLSVEVKDRWTFIPVPIISFSADGSWRSGALAIESNFLGLNKTLGLGFFYGSKGWTLLSFFSYPNLGRKAATLTFGFTAGLEDSVFKNTQEITLREFSSDQFSLSTDMEYPLFGPLSLLAGIEYDRSIPRIEGETLSEVPELDAFGLSGGLQWKDLYYDIPYDRGTELKISSSWNWGFRDTKDFLIIKGGMKWSFTPWLNHLLTFSLNGGWGNVPVQRQFRLGGLPGTYILPMGYIGAEEYMATTVVYNIPLLFFRWGSLSSKLFYEGGIFNSDLVDTTPFHGPGLGLELYINNLAIPAVGMNLAWNLETGKMQFSAGIGMGGRPE